ncbi:MAG: hypothetical protein GY711_11525 [bacterium]|nr:hypothetical protein [bacterium]
MKDNPYRAEIIGAFLLSAIVLPIETWRRWGQLLSPAALDDGLIFVSAMVVAAQLARRSPAAPVWWLFVCGGAWFIICLSVWGSIYQFDDGDPSGVSVPAVIAFKLVVVTLISLASWRAIRRVRSADPYGGGPR